jgi:TolB-like protein/Tfp pilus assembly protein PilF
MGKQHQRIYEFGPFRLDAAERLLLCDKQPVPLKPKAFDLLLLFVQNSGHILEKDKLMEQVWPDSFVEEGNLAVTVFALRKALRKDTGEPSYIETVPRHGYRFVASVKAAQLEPADLEEQPSNGFDEYEIGARLESIAVLPFKPIGALADQDYLGLGLADALITRLSNLKQLVVRSTSTVRKCATAERDPIMAGRELGVALVLDGNIQKLGQRIRVTVQLVDVRNGASLWADKFDEQFTDIFALEDSISEQVTKAMMLKLTGKEKRLLTKHHTENVEAYEAYLKGRYFWNKRTLEGLNKAIDYFERARAIDPNYAPAYVGLADGYNFLRSFYMLPRQEAGPKTRKAILEALQLDDTLAEAHTCLAQLSLFEWDWLGAQREARRAIELNPRYAEAHQRYASCLRIVGRFEEAIIENKKALQLDPLSLVYNSSLGLSYQVSRHHDPAIDQLHKTLEIDPNFGMAHFFLGLAYEAKRWYDESIREYQLAISFGGNQTEISSALGHTFAVSGRRCEAQKILDDLKKPAKRGYVPLYFIALIYMGLGEDDQAYAWFEKAYADRCDDMGSLLVDTRLDRLRADPRFIGLLERVGLVPERNHRSV